MADFYAARDITTPPLPWPSIPPPFAVFHLSEVNADALRLLPLLKGEVQRVLCPIGLQALQKNLNGAVHALARKDINENFPLRGFVSCDDCGQPLTSCWSKGLNKHYPYYLCDTKGCPSNRKSIARAKVEDGAEDILKALEPVRSLVAMAKVMFADILAVRLKESEGTKAELQKQIKDAEKQIEGFLDRIVDANSQTVITAYESRIEKLERQKLKLTDQLENAGEFAGYHNDIIDPALRFLTSHWNIYKISWPCIAPNSASFGLFRAP